MNVNYESDDFKNESQWQIATSLNVVILLTQENDIHLELSNRFSPRHNDDQNLTTKDQQVQFLIYLRKFQLIVETSPHATNTVRNKRPLVCTIENYLKKFIPFTIPGNSD